jgi:hypothetical protein
MEPNLPGWEGRDKGKLGLEALLILERVCLLSGFLFFLLFCILGPDVFLQEDLGSSSVSWVQSSSMFTVRRGQVSSLLVILYCRLAKPAYSIVRKMQGLGSFAVGVL